MVGGHAVDHLGDENRLAHTGSAEQADLASLEVRGEQVDDLHARLEHLGLGLEGVECRCLTVDLPAVGDLPKWLVVELVTDDVEHVTEGHVAHRHGDTPYRCCGPRCHG